MALLIPLTLATASTATLVRSDWEPTRPPARVVLERARPASTPIALERQAASEAAAHTESEKVARPRRPGPFMTDSAPYVIAISPDGRYLASGHRDDVVRLWDAETGRLIGRTVHVMTGSLTWSRDSAQLAIAGGLRVRVWSVAAGTKPLVLTRTYPHTEDVVFGPCGNQISNDDNVWDLHTGRPLLVPKAEDPQNHNEVDTDEAFDEDGLSDAPFEGPTTNAPIGLGGLGRVETYLAPRGGWCVKVRRKTMTIESTNNGHRFATINARADILAIAADNRWIYSSDGRDVRVWDGWNGAPSGKFDVPAPATCLTASDHYLWVGCADGTIRRFRAP